MNVAESVHDFTPGGLWSRRLTTYSPQTRVSSEDFGMNPTIICPHRGHHNSGDTSSCSACARLLRAADQLRSLLLALGIPTVLSGLLWGAVLYFELNQ
jgi:hypothetical protein